MECKHDGELLCIQIVREKFVDWCDKCGAIRFHYFDNKSHKSNLGDWKIPNQNMEVM